MSIALKHAIALGKYEVDDREVARSMIMRGCALRVARGLSEVLVPVEEFEIRRLGPFDGKAFAVEDVA